MKKTISNSKNSRVGSASGRDKFAAHQSFFVSTSPSAMKMIGEMVTNFYAPFSFFPKHDKETFFAQMINNNIILENDYAKIYHDMAEATKMFRQEINNELGNVADNK